MTLSDQEQRELYEAAQIIQKAYRSYKGRKKTAQSSEHQEREAKAAVVIQNYYRRYKQVGVVYACSWLVRPGVQGQLRESLNLAFFFFFQYLYWKQMSKAATVIQTKYRTYCEHKRFKKSQEAAMRIQSYYRTYKEHQGGGSVRTAGSSRESTPGSSGLK